MINEVLVAQALKNQAQIAADALSVELKGDDSVTTVSPSQSIIIETLFNGEDNAVGMADDSSDIQIGTYQLSCRTPKTDGNKWHSRNLANDIRAYFQRGTPLSAGGQSLRVRSTTTAPLLINDTHYNTVLRIQFSVIM